MEAQTMIGPMRNNERSNRVRCWPIFRALVSTYGAIPAPRSEDGEGLCGSLGLGALCDQGLDPHADIAFSDECKCAFAVSIDAHIELASSRRFAEIDFV